jgi:hypothetical protein
MRLQHLDPEPEEAGLIEAALPHDPAVAKHARPHVLQLENFTNQDVLLRVHERAMAVHDECRSAEPVPFPAQCDGNPERDAPTPARFEIGSRLEQ